MQRQVLTQQQYKRANKVILIILTLCYICFVGIETSNASKFGVNAMVFVRCGLYALAFVAMSIIVKTLGTRKIGTIAIAVVYVIAYAILVFGNGAGTLIMAFPAIIGFMVFLNEVLILSGTVATFIISIIKCVLEYRAGQTEALGFASVAILGSFVAIWCSKKAIRLLMEFSEENQSEIKKAAEHREEVAKIVSGSVQELDKNFNAVRMQLNSITEAMNVAHDSMDEITRNSEGTAEAINHQADMTGQIQDRLVNANATASGARDITDRVKTAIVDGKKQADELKEQSGLVDQNTVRISEAVEALVSNVQKVSGIVEAILNISDQTNLLALNASIEAARAGEAGRGFSVVADQIRNLAEESKDSTEQIIAIINELTNVTAETQGALHKSVDSIEIQRQKVQEVNARFTEVESGMRELENGVETMTVELANVMEANKGIVESISTLSAASEEVLAGTQIGKETIDSTFDSMKTFSETVDGTFEQLQILKKVAVEE